MQELMVRPMNAECLCGQTVKQTLTANACANTLLTKKGIAILCKIKNQCQGLY